MESNESNLSEVLQDLQERFILGLMTKEEFLKESTYQIWLAAAATCTKNGDVMNEYQMLYCTGN